MNTEAKLNELVVLRKREDELASLKARVVSVLEPFAEVAERKLQGWVSHAHISSWLDIFLTVGHCRDARALRDELVGGQKEAVTTEAAVKSGRFTINYECICGMITNIQPLGDLCPRCLREGLIYPRQVPTLDEVLEEPTPEPICKCGKVESKHWSGVWCTPTTHDNNFDKFTPVPVAEPEVAVDALSLADLRKANVERQSIWCPAQKPDLSFRGVELAGEVGEACNIIKKLERERLGWRGSKATIEQLAEELADVVIVADLIGQQTGIDLSKAVTEKFNATSAKVGIAVTLPTKTSGSTPATGASWPCDNPLTDVPMDRQVIELNQRLQEAIDYEMKHRNENTRLRELLARVREIHRSTPEGVAMKVPNSLATEIDNALAGGGGK